ncbi:MAG: hypothetical protein ACRC1M_01200 [Methanobacteriaceae archaeon]
MLNEIFGKYPQVKVIDYLLAHPFNSYTKQQIAVGSEISRITLNKFIDDLITLNILTKEEGNKYSLNSKSDIVKMLDDIQHKLAIDELKKQSQTFNEEAIQYTDEEIENMFPTDVPNIDLNLAEKEIIELDGKHNTKHNPTPISETLANLNKRLTKIEIQYKNSKHL